MDGKLLVKQLDALIDEEADFLPVLANASALLYDTLPELNWAGFYLVRNGELLLGVCGTAWKEERCLRVPDVHAFPGHIACDAASRSEIVLPVRSGGRIVAVLDIDSPVKERFTAEDEEVLTAFAGTIGERAVFPESF